MTAARCEQTELLAAECAHCTGATLIGDPADLVIAYTFEAGYPGRCDHCGRPFDQGQTVCRIAVPQPASGTEHGGIACPTCTRKAKACP